MMHAPVHAAAAGSRVELSDCNDPGAIRAIEGWLTARPDATAFHRPAWLLAAARGTGQEALFLTLRSAGGAISAYLPLTLVHSPLFGRALVSSGFAVGGGIVADTTDCAARLARAALALAHSRSCPTVELRGGMAPEDSAPGGRWIEKTDAYLGFERPLAVDDEAELRAVPKRHRAEIRKGLERGYAVTIGSGERLRAIHYALYCRSVHNLGTPVFPRALFDAVLDAFGEDADILLISDGDRPLSSVLTLYHDGRCLPYWQGADRNAREARSNEVLYFRLMAHARLRGCAVFDFGRSKAGTGAAAYKKNWGFEPQPLRYFVHAAPGHEPREINPTAAQYRRKVDLWKRLPPFVADRLGPVIARGLG